jgi:hypothetical protein
VDELPSRSGRKRIRKYRNGALTRTTTSDEHSRETPLPGTVTFQAAVELMLCAVRALTADARATPLERVEFESASQRLLSGTIMSGEPIQG